MSIFQSRAWQEAWWNVWGRQAGFTLMQPGSGGGSGLYIDSYQYRKVLPVRCLQFVGTNYRRISTPRTEYNCLSLEGSEFAASRLDSLNSLDWTDAVFRDMRRNSDEIALIESWAKANNWRLREVHRDRAYSIETEGDFGTYAGKLGASTRLKLLNRRKVLEHVGDVQIENCWPHSYKSFFSILNKFHEDRWGSPCFNSDSLRFHFGFLHRVESEGGSPDLSLMTVGGAPVSVVYNVLFQGCQYNLQSGFEENFHRKIALGTIHLGYCLEHAFADSGIKTFDLLAGAGKNTDYKAHLTDTYSDLVSIMVVRSRAHQTLYRCKKELARVKQSLRRVGA